MPTPLILTGARRSARKPIEPVRAIDGEPPLEAVR
jgi:hypothetical protein